MDSIVIMGVAGSGKTHIGSALAAALSIPFIEGDAFHSEANIAKMSSGQPLSDADRAPWLAALNAQLQQAHASGQRVVLACSALKQSYREQLGQGGVPLTFVWLNGAPHVLAARLQRRRRHFMPATLLQSQLDALEPPHDAIEVDASLPVETILASLLVRLG